MVNEGVIKVVARLLGLKPNEVKPESELEAGLGMDSLDRVEVVMMLEDEFDVILEDETAHKCATVAELAAVVEQALKIARDAKASLGGAAE